ncbi:MAG TPA: histidine triad nucleotide-binding protein [Candidatus Faeciplasma gallinarum]|uniref:Histidine triad nucleotide-binding protein n=1 Tax=Candidatus Faeciplasma gallinarum TaxID=2840799 RepID=A0A9D1EQJ4_9FIRM|nr:histidine triad nucleotide-binding protein [Candidatus Faeciplasma gallinarum]
MSDCLFCKIVSGDVPSKKVYEDEYVYAFEDINPVAPVHILFIPKEHISGVSEITPANSEVISKIFEAIAKVTAEKGLDKNGFRVVSNCGADAGQTVFHLHFHVIGGTKLNWP